MGDFGQANLEAAVEQVIGILDAGHAGQPQALGEFQKAHHAPGRFIGQADVADLARLNEIIQGGEGFQQRRRLRALGMRVAQPAEEIGVPVGPMQLVEVDVIGLQTFEAGVQGGRDLRPGETGSAVTNPGQPIGPSHDFGGDDQLIAPA
jgi:hypothetical protein